MIGVFDSGFGGLTILRALVERLPGHQYLYLGDNGRAPYGSRPQPEIVALTADGLALLFARGCNLVILACNTTSANALRPLQEEWLPKNHPNKRVLGIVVPTVEQITGTSWDAPAKPSRKTASVTTIGVLGTRQTVRSGAYVREINKRNPAARVVQQPCPDLVPMIESGTSDRALREAARGYVNALLQKKDALIHHPLEAVLLGCTHYELIAPLIAESLPSGVTLYSQPRIVAERLAEYLPRHPELVPGKDGGTQHYLTTGQASWVSEVGQRFYGDTVAFEGVELPERNVEVT